VGWKKIEGFKVGETLMLKKQNSIYFGFFSPLYQSWFMLVPRAQPQMTPTPDYWFDPLSPESASPPPPEKQLLLRL